MRQSVEISQNMLVWRNEKNISQIPAELIGEILFSPSFHKAYFILAVPKAMQ